MHGLDETAGQPLRWRPAPAAKKAYDLRAGEDTVGTLRWERRILAAADVADQRWTFKREGFWQPRVTIRAAGATGGPVTFRFSWLGAGALELAPARRIAWSAANPWRTRWTWRDADGHPLVRFTSRHGWTKYEGSVVIEQAALAAPEVHLLVALGWYLLLLSAQDTAAVGAWIIAAL